MPSEPPNAKRDPVFYGLGQVPGLCRPGRRRRRRAREAGEDQAEFNKLVARERRSPINTGIDGGMNACLPPNCPTAIPAFRNAVIGPCRLTLARAPGTIPATVNPPRGTPDEPFVA